MKKNYVSFEFTVVTFKIEDVITTSGVGIKWSDVWNDDSEFGE